jgi:hypothetical protein
MMISLRLAVLLLAPSMAVADPPRVAKATPDNGDADVDPGLTEIRVEFDRDMAQGGHSICGGGETFPRISGKLRWIDKRTAAIPVKLEPDHRYDLSINCPAATNFRSAAGEPVEPYPISFTTGDGRRPKGKENRKAVLEGNRASRKELERAIDEKYSYRDLRKVDWGKLFKERGPRLEKAAAPAAFAREAAKLLEHAKDLHIWLRVGGQTIGTFRQPAPATYDLEALGRLVPEWRKRSGAVFTGKPDPGTGYVLIATWAPGNPADLESAYEALDDFRELKGLVVDVRPNGGGDELLARDFAGCFISKPCVYSRNDYRDESAGGFTKVLDRVVEPKKGRPAYRGKVAVLVGPGNMSSCESFILMMRCADRCRLFGERTRGSSGNPKPTELSNGVTVFLPSWRDMYPDGTLLEGNGITPDVVVKVKPADLSRKDAVLEAALAWLRE